MAEARELSNGITVLVDQDDRADTACVVVGVAIGANHEREDEHGLAHFFEHMCFKGTEAYPDAARLITRIEESGLIANAYTGRECTGYHVSGRSEMLDDMIEITADIFLRSLFPENELNKEKKVIIEEIAMYEDDPASKAFDTVDASLFHGTEAGHHILGTAESARSFSRDHFIRFLEERYTTGNTIISIAGKADGEKVMRKLEETYAGARKGERTGQAVIAPGTPKKAHQHVLREDLGQTHIVIGARAPAYVSDDRYAAEVFDVALGASMSSRLFFRVREKLGACYAIKSFMDLMTHAGSFYIHTSIAGERAEEVMGAIADECANIKKNPVGEQELRKAKEFLLGSCAVTRENTRAVASERMSQHARTGAVETVEEYEKKIMGVTSDDVRRVAGDILRGDALSVCYVSKKDVPESVTDRFRERVGT